MVYENSLYEYNFILFSFVIRIDYTETLI